MCVGFLFVRLGCEHNVGRLEKCPQVCKLSPHPRCKGQSSCTLDLAAAPACCHYMLLRCISSMWAGSRADVVTDLALRIGREWPNDHLRLPPPLPLLAATTGVLSWFFKPEAGTLCCLAALFFAPTREKQHAIPVASRKDSRCCFHAALCLCLFI